MRPLNYAILKYMTTIESASAEDVIIALKKDYSKFKMLNKAAVLEALMTAEQNGLLEKANFKLDENGEPVIYFKTTEYGKNMINYYIK